MADVWISKHQADPEFQARELVRDPAVRPVSAKELDDLDFWLPLACAAYEETPTLERELEKKDLTLLYQDETTLGTDRTSHFLAYNSERKIVVVGVRGTANIDDALTDCVCRSIPSDALSAAKGKGEKVFMMEGIGEAALYLKGRLGPILRDAATSAQYEIVVTGHSLGAGTAALLAMFLKEELGISRVRAVGFATPAVATANIGLSTKDYITSVVNHADIIPRASVRNVAILATTMEGVNRVRKTDGAQAAQEQVPEIALAAARTHKKAADDLIIPGKVVYLFSDGNNKYHGVTADGTLPVLGSIIPCDTVITNHLTEGVGYIEAMQAIRR
eukprot:g1582.t1